MKNSRLMTIFLVVFVDLLGFSLILPLLPYYAEAYGATPTIIGLLVASYAAAQLIGAPLLGRLSDRIGRKPVLLISVIGTGIGFLLLGFADPIGHLLAGWIAPQAANAFVLAVLFLSRALDGLTGGNITVAQAYITDVTDDQNRAKGLGLIGAAFGLGFIIGPAVGGALSNWGYNLPAFVAAFVSFINILMIIFLLPESLSAERRSEVSGQDRPPFTLKALNEALKRPKVGPLLQVRFFFALAFAIFQTIFALYAQTIGLSSQTTGILLAYVGVLSVVTQGGLIGFLTRRFRENSLMISGLWIMAGALLAWAFTTQLWYLVVLILPMAVAGGVSNTIIQSATTKSVTRKEVGGILGISASLEAVTRIIAPIAGGYLLQHLGVWAPGIFSAVLMAWTIILAYWRIVLPSKSEKLAKEAAR
ncbi:MAG: MFS transporter [Chloroflexi bacterium RBG_13_50_21]|nr:MAG: MFS transporter [Chloroflexi bacterium RBG_13_50_21]OGO66268.1 MAG: MFS transporter [Chloroflexi bacterium RBG_19FT_COMBO_47_9]